MIIGQVVWKHQWKASVGKEVWKTTIFLWFFLWKRRKLKYVLRFDLLAVLVFCSLSGSATKLIWLMETLHNHTEDARNLCSMFLLLLSINCLPSHMIKADSTVRAWINVSYRPDVIIGQSPTSERPIPPMGSTTLIITWFQISNSISVVIDKGVIRGAWQGVKEGSSMREVCWGIYWERGEESKCFDMADQVGSQGIV